MTRTEKIDLVRLGKYIIENDMKGSKEADYVLRNISQVKLTTIWNFYGIFDLTNRFTFLSITQLNDRPRFKMSELVEVEEPTEQKQFITRDELKRLWLNFTFTELATKINQMAFEAYSKAEKF